MAKSNHKGWIKSWRKSEDDELYFSQPFDKWHAWHDLLYLAGQNGEAENAVLTSLRALKTRWLWKSDYKVRTHLNALKNAGKIDFKNAEGKTLITIKKWDFYQNGVKRKNAPKTKIHNAVQNAQEDIYIKEEAGKKSEIFTPAEEKNEPWEGFFDDGEEWEEESE